MKKILQTILFLTFTITFCQDALSTIPPPPDDQDICEANGGTWIELDGCGDSCTLVEDPDTLCPDFAGEACDCGNDACWDDDEKECISNDEFSGDLNTENSAAGCTLNYSPSLTAFEKFYPLLGIFSFITLAFFLRQKRAGKASQY